MDDDSILQAISKGNVAYFRQVDIDRNFVNDIFFNNKDVEIKPPSGKCFYKTINSPTPLVLAILLEKPEILQYFIDNFDVDYFKTVNGMYPLHFACLTGDYECLRVLLQQPVVRECINIAKEEKFVVPEEHATTPLFLAAANGLHAHALLLTHCLPDVLNPVEGSEYPPADAKILSATGNSALHIAAFNDDWDMFQIIMHACNGIKIKSDDEETPLSVAKIYISNSVLTNFQSKAFTPFNQLVAKYVKEEYMPKKLESGAKTAKETDGVEEEVEEEEDEIDVLKEEVSLLTARVQQLVSRIVDADSQ